MRKALAISGLLVLLSGMTSAATKYTVSCWVDGGGSVTGTGKYAKGATVTLTAKPKSGWVFSGYWSLPTCVDCGPGKTVKMSGNTYSFKMASQNAPIGATFVRKNDDWIDEFVCDDVWYIGRYDGAQEFEYGAVDSLSKVSYSVSGLPKGIVKSGLYLKCDKPTSVKPGFYTATLTANNRSGKKTTKKVRITVGNKEDWDVFPGLDTSFDGYQVQVGLPLSEQLDCFVETASGWKITASGLPPGVKWNSSSKSFSGVPTKKGNYVVTLKGVKGKTSRTATAFFRVAPLPAAVVGTFNGFLSYDWTESEGDSYGDPVHIESARFRSDSKLAKITVASSGEITATVGSEKFTHTGFQKLDGGLYRVTMSNKKKITSGSYKGCYLTKSLQIVINPYASWTTQQLRAFYSSGYSCSCGATLGAVVAQRNPFGKDSDGNYLNYEAGAIIRKYVSLGKRGIVVGKDDGFYYLSCLECVYCPAGRCTPGVYVKVGSTGSVSISGKIGGKSISGSGQLIVMNDGDSSWYVNRSVARFIVKSSDGKKTFVIQLEYYADSDYGAYAPNGYAVTSGKIGCCDFISLDDPYDDCCHEYEYAW